MEMTWAMAMLVFLVPALILAVGLAAPTTAIYAYDGEAAFASGVGHVPSGGLPEDGVLAMGAAVDEVGHRYDHSANRFRAFARTDGYPSAPQTAGGAGTDLVCVGDFADDAAAFGHYAKYFRGIEYRPNGGYRLKAGGRDPNVLPA